MTPFDTPGKQAFWKHCGKRKGEEYMHREISGIWIAHLLTLKAPFTKMVASTASIDQDQAAQNVQPDLWTILSTMLKHYKQKIVMKICIYLWVYLTL